MNETIRNRIDKMQQAGLLVGGAGVLLGFVGAWANSQQFFVSYLFAYVFWVGLSLGCLGVAMIHHLTGGRWGFVTRRFLEAGFMTLPLMAALFVPVAVGLPELYPWARPEVVAASEALRHKQAYLNVPAWLGRAVFFFLVWIVMASLLRKWSVEQDRSPEARPTIRMRSLSGPGIVIYPLTGTFAFVDWVMSLQPSWHSTIFLVIVLIGQILTALAFVTVLIAWLHRQEPYSSVLSPKHFHALGNLLLAFVVFWTYVSFGQLLVVYSGNLPHEIDWYVRRTGGGWKWVVCGLALFHFFVPFFLLLFRTMKLDVRRLGIIATLILSAHVGAVFWLVVPAFHPENVRIHWLDATAFFGVGGLWIAAFAFGLKKQQLLPRNDPRIEYSITLLADAK